MTIPPTLQFPSNFRSVREDNKVFPLFLFFSFLYLTPIHPSFKAFPVFNARIKITTFCLFVCYWANIEGSKRKCGGKHLKESLVLSFFSPFFSLNLYLKAILSSSCQIPASWKKKQKSHGIHQLQERGKGQNQEPGKSNGFLTAIAAVVRGEGATRNIVLFTIELSLWQQQKKMVK